MFIFEAYLPYFLTLNVYNSKTVNQQDSILYNQQDLFN